MINIIATDTFTKKAKKFFKKHPDLKSRFKKILILLSANPAHSSLRLHYIERHHVHSISITIRYRAMIRVRIKDDGCIYLMDIGNHDELY